MSKLPKPPASVALEDLLRLKRAERPDADFWNEFEHGLRQKQLAAIMEPKPWWLGWSLALRRHGAWAGATVAVAALALGVGLRMAAPASSGGMELVSAPVAGPAGQGAETRARAESRPAAALVLAGATKAAANTSASYATGRVRSEELNTSGAMEPTEAADTGAAAVANVTPGGAAPAAPDVLRGALAQVAMLVGGEFGRPASAMSVTALAVLEPAGMDFAAEPVIGILPGPTFAASSQVDLPMATNPRHQRLLAGVAEEADDMGSSRQSLAVVRDHVLHHVMDADALYASISRLGVRGDRLQLRF